MATQNKNKISVGDHVQFTLGTSSVRGVVVEDRGPIGVGKGRIFRIRISKAPYDDEEFEFPGDQLEVIDQDAS